MKTDSEIHAPDEALYLALCAAFAVDPETPEARRRFRPAFRGGGVMDRVADRAADICWYDLRTAGDADAAATAPDLFIARAETPVGAPFFPLTARRSLILRAVLMFYGPHAAEDAEKARLRMLADTGFGCPRAILRASRLVPAAVPDPPNVFSEPDGTVWRTRADLELRLRLLRGEELETPAVLLPPVITIRCERSPGPPASAPTAGAPEALSSAPARPAADPVT